MKKLLFVLLFWAGAIFAGESYELVWLGDMHYDARELHAADYLANTSDKSAKAFARNLHSWGEGNDTAAPSRKLLALAGEAARSADFAFQIGDFAHGHAGSRELAEKMYSRALAIMKSYFGVALYVAPGNHEYAGEGAQAALKSTLSPYLDRELNATFSGFNFAFSHKGDAYIFWDSAKPDLAWLLDALAARKDARYTFLVTHFPVLPVGEGKAGWVPFGKAGKASERKALLDALCESRAIVLCGHIHEQTLLEYESKRGKITQISAFSLFGPKKPMINGEIKEGGVELYKAKKSVREGLEGGGYLARLLGEYIPHITRYAHIDGAGYCVLKVSDEGVTNEFKGFGGEEVTRVLKAR